MVFHGAWDLWPRTAWFAKPGRVTVEVLDDFDVGGPDLDLRERADALNVVYREALERGPSLAADQSAAFTESVAI